jgi:hypothetical protein
MGGLMLGKLLLGNPYVLIGIAAAIALSIGAAVWFRHEATVARESQAVAERQAAISAADAERWQRASTARDATIAQLKTALDEQSAAVAAGRAKEAALRTSLDSARATNDRLSDERDRLSRELDAEAAKAPGDVREVGPIVARRVPALFE